MTDTTILPGKQATMQKHNYLAVSIATTRSIFTCKNKLCKHVWAVDYRKVFSYMGGNSYYPERAEYDMYQVSNGEQKSCINTLCPCCKHIGIEKIVKGKQSEHVCDARCTGAKGADCECSCGGENHGKDYIAALSSMPGAYRY
ncbi:MAG: hypothetical protein ABI406_18700 [Ktedonobacteraceae bacterium]